MGNFAPMMRRFISERVRSFRKDCRAGTLVVFGIASPVLALGVAATVEYASLAARRTKLQTAADAAALAGAQQLRLSNSTDGSVDGTVKAVVQGALPPQPDSRMTIASLVGDKRSAVDVTIQEVVPSTLGKLMSLPTMQIGVTASAKISGTTKLCLLTLDASNDRALHLDKDSFLTATGCAVVSNSTDKKGLSADKNARVTASMICSAGGVEDKGAIFDPRPTTDCPAMADPLASIGRPSPALCRSIAQKVTGAVTLWPGTYCLGLTISGNAQATFMPGTYVFDNGPLIVTDTASLIGQNVALYFTGNAGGMRLDPDTTINLTAPRDGPYAGMLMLEDRSLGIPIPLPPGPTGLPVLAPLGSPPMRQYRITSDNAPTLLGTIYLPAGRLIIDAKRPVSDRSAFTVIVARQLELNSGPNLYLNTDYGSTDIPVPDGVGPKTGAVALRR